MGSAETFALVACVATGVSLFVLARMLLSALASEDVAQGEEWKYDVNRMNDLRQASALYRVFFPLVQLLARINRRAFRELLPSIGEDLQMAGAHRSWTPEEYLGRWEIMALLLTPIWLALCLEIMGPPGAVVAVLLTLLTVWGMRRSLRTSARRRLFRIKLRLPYLLDLLTLLMESGSTFLDALRDAVREAKGHPVGVEFGRVLAEMRMGKTRTTAFEALRERLPDPEIGSIVGSIIQGEQLGTPLAILFRTQADLLRIKRSQRAETVAGEAAVKMLLPGIMIMAATVMIILGPFILGFLYDDLFG